MSKKARDRKPLNTANLPTSEATATWSVTSLSEETLMASPEIVALEGAADSPQDLFLPAVIASRILNGPKFSRSQEVSTKHASVTHKKNLSTIKLFYPSLFCLLFPF